MSSRSRLASLARHLERHVGGDAPGYAEAVKSLVADLPGLGLVVNDRGATTR